MAKKMYDSELWNKEWFINYPLLQKGLFLFLMGVCDCAGIYEPNYRMLQTIFGKKVKREDFLNLNAEKIQIKELGNGKIFLIDYILFQNKLNSLDDLNPNFSVHKGIIERLNKNNVFETLNQPLGSLTLEGLQDKGMGIGKGKNLDINCSPEIEKVFEIYKSECKDLLPLTYERSDRKTRESVGEFLQTINYNFEDFKDICQKANKLVVIATSKIDLQSILNNFKGIKSGKYKKDSNVIEGLFDDLNGGESG